jgi:hypothetical protein
LAMSVVKKSAMVLVFNNIAWAHLSDSNKIHPIIKECVGSDLKMCIAAISHPY